MKHFKYAKLFVWLTAATMLLTTSCKDDLFGESGLSDEVTVTFTLVPEAMATMRGTNYDDGYVTYPDAGEFPHISDGSKTDMLIYALYEGDKLLEGYTDGSDFPGIDHGDGQSIKKIKHFPCTVTLTLKRGVEYSIAFWAQNSKCKAYNTSDLKKVEVIYSELDNSTEEPEGDSNTDGPQTVAENSDAFQTTTPNNDETRDAFCRSVKFTAGADGLEKTVYLYRPLAQINVGTSGYDFETITRNAQKKYLYSKIRLNRVARYLDVVKDKTYFSTTRDEKDDPYSGSQTKEAFAVADFGYAKIPAYVNMEIPKKPSYTIWDWDYNESKDAEGNIVYDAEGNIVYNFTHPDKNTREDYAGEEFLKVHLYDSSNKEENFTKDNFPKATNEDGDDGDGYRDYANMLNYNNTLSETFKYLSMCYVLTSSTKEEKILISNVKVWLATGDDPTAADFDEIEVVNLNNVPAQRNWRTNIVGNLLTEQTVFNVSLDKDFAGEYSGWAVDGEWKELSGPLADGVYYDAKADEIQISNANGLLWFQQMVNGTMKIRETFNWLKIGDDYTYGNDGKTKFKYDGIAEPTDDVLRARILRAVHHGDAYKQTSLEEINKIEWPKNGNFHFCGKDSTDQATVKLMADIDLSGIEWVPIGFDGRILETVAIDFYASNPANRGFYGIFEGNDHTISNLSTKRFSATVPDWAQERTTQSYTNKGKQYTASYKYVDNFQWFGRGLFGEIGGDAKIRGVRLLNVDIYGCHGVGGVVGIAYGHNIEITNCVVDGGSIIVTPMYRGDAINTGNDGGLPQGGHKSRTFARGVYLGGIVGYFNTVDGKVDDCEVKNLYMRGYRRVGGLIGSVDLADNKDSNANTKNSKSDPASISNNRISNTTIVASQFSTFGIRYGQSEGDITNKVNDVSAPRDKITQDKNGFGWDKAAFDLYANDFVGGDIVDYIDKYKEKCSNNSMSGVTLAKFTETVDENTGERSSVMEAAPLDHMPILSSWFTDKISLKANYYGNPSAKTIMNVYPFDLFGKAKPMNSAIIQEAKYYPMQLPGQVEVVWDKTSKNVGLYVESVELDGTNGLGGRSLITPSNVSGEGECALFVTARDRKQFWDGYKSGSKPADSYYRKETVISDIVVRGNPYAYTGILLSPNENMSKVVLNGVAIYDVYQTIALNSVAGSGDQWPKVIDASNTDIEVNNSNLRGYTVPGKGWKNITFEGTTFEEGTYTGNGDRERTYKAEGKTAFKDCIFKAPYIINLSDESVLGTDNVSFVMCRATSTSTKTEPIDIGYKKEEGGKLREIVIISSAQGHPIVIYCRDNGNYGSDKNNYVIVDGQWKMVNNP